MDDVGRSDFRDEYVPSHIGGTCLPLSFPSAFIGLASLSHPKGVAKLPQAQARVVSLPQTWTHTCTPPTAAAAGLSTFLAVDLLFIIEISAWMSHPSPPSLRPGN